MNDILCPKCKKSIDNWIDKNGYVYGECSCGQVIGDALYEMLKQFQSQLDIAKEGLNKIIEGKPGGWINGFVLRRYDEEIAKECLQKLEEKYESKIEGSHRNSSKGN